LQRCTGISSICPYDIEIADSALIISTNTGVYYKNNYRDSWQSLNTNLEDYSAYDLELIDDGIYASGYGIVSRYSTNATKVQKTTYGMKPESYYFRFTDLEILDSSIYVLGSNYNSNPDKCVIYKKELYAKNWTRFFTNVDNISTAIGVWGNLIFRGLDMYCKIYYYDINVGNVWNNIYCDYSNHSGVKDFVFDDVSIYVLCREHILMTSDTGDNWVVLTENWSPADGSFKEIVYDQGYLFFTETDEASCIDLATHRKHCIDNGLNRPGYGTAIQSDGEYLYLGFWDDGIWRRRIEDIIVDIKEKEIKTQPALKIYPNPASSKVFIECSSIVNTGLIRIYDLHGKVHFKIVIDGSDVSGIDVSGYASGIYIICIDSSDYSYSEKLVIN